MTAVPTSYTRIKASQLESSPFEAWCSTASQDPYWDSFLQSTPLGQYQQSGMWAEYKAGEGWKHHRVILKGAGEISGGFQLLWKKKGPLRMGYVLKGPVVWPENTKTTAILKNLLVQSAHDIKLTFLLAQDPDDAKHTDGTSEALGFIASNPAQLVDTTYLINVDDDMEIIRKRMSKSLQRNIRKARNLGVTIREGKESDLPYFFELMASSCARQKTSPNPASAEALRRLWRAFAPSHSIRLTLAEREGDTPAGRICLVFGNRSTHWKKGWDGSHSNWYAAALLDDAAFEWAHMNGLKICDFGAISRLSALHMQEGKNLTDETTSTSDQFKLRYGGYAKILPSAYIYFPNSILRWSYRVFYPYLEKCRNRSIQSKIKTSQLQATGKT